MSETEAAKAIEAFFKAFNAHDNEAYQKALHYPHIRINNNGRVIIIQDPADWSLERALTYLAKNEGWEYSTLDSVKVIQASEVKVHFDIEFSRYKKDGSRYAVHKSLWIVTKKDGQWGVQARSSFAP